MDRWYLPHKPKYLMCSYNGRHKLFKWTFCPNFLQPCYVFLVVKQYPHQMCKWFSIVSHISSFKPPVTLQLSHSMHLEKYSTCNLSWDIITKEKRGKHKKHKLWNSRIWGTALSNCSNSSCYSLAFELLTLPQYVVTLTTKQHFIYLFIFCVMWIGTLRHTVNLYISLLGEKQVSPKCQLFRNWKTVMFLSWSQSIFEMLRRDVF